jgi:hypothetical protein
MSGKVGCSRLLSPISLNFYSVFTLVQIVQLVLQVIFASVRKSAASTTDTVAGRGGKGLDLRVHWQLSKCRIEI